MAREDRGGAEEPVYLIGTSGHPNYGDEFITAAWLRFLATSRPEAEVWLDCPNPGLSSHLFRGLHPRLRTTDSLWRLMWETRGMDPGSAAAHVDRGVVELGTPTYDLGLLDAREARTVHVLGGGYINAAWPHNALLLRAALRLREVSGARLVATGLGLATAPDADMLRETLTAFDHATVRDAESAKLAGVEPSCDDAFLGVRIGRRGAQRRARRRRHRRRLGVPAERPGGAGGLRGGPRRGPRRADRA